MEFAAVDMRRRAAGCGRIGRLWRVAAGIALLAVATAGSAAAQEIRLAYLTGDTTLPGILSAWRAVLDERPELRERVSVSLVTESLLDLVDPEEVLRSDVLVLHVHDAHTLERFDATYDVDLVERITGQGLVLGVGEGLQPREHYVERGVAWDLRARAFWEHSGFANQVGLLKYVLSAAGVPGLDVPEPQPSLQAGYYYPDPAGAAGAAGSGGRAFADWDAFDAWRRAAGKHRPGAPRVAVGFYGSSYDDGDTALVDAVIAEIERQGRRGDPDLRLSGRHRFRDPAPRSGRGGAGGRRADVPVPLRRPRRRRVASEARHPGPQPDQPLREKRGGMARLGPGAVHVRGDVPGRRSGAGGAGRADGGREQGAPHGSGHGIDHHLQSADLLAHHAGRTAGAGLRGARRHRERRQAGGGPLLQLPPGKGRHRGQLPERRRVACERPPADAGGRVRPRWRRCRPVVRSASRADDRPGAERRRVRPRRAGRDADPGRRRARLDGRLSPLARRLRARAAGESGRRLGQSGGRDPHGEGRQLHHPGPAFRQRRGAAAAGPRVGRGRREAVSRQGSGAAPPVCRDLLLVAGARAGRLRRPMPSSTWGRTAPSSGWTARTWGCPRPTRRTR